MLYFVISLIQISINFQVPRILNPIVNVIEAIPQLVSENKGGLGDLIKKNYGSAEECQISILQVIPYHMTGFSTLYLSLTRLITLNYNYILF